MCDRCRNLDALKARADAIRANGEGSDVMEAVESDLMNHFARVIAEDGPQPNDAKFIAYVRGVILEGKGGAGPFMRPAQVFAGTPQELVDVLKSVFEPAPEPASAPKTPTLDEWLEAANMNVENVIARLDPSIRLASAVKAKFEAAEFSPAVAEQMAAAVFIKGLQQ